LPRPGVPFLVALLVPGLTRILSDLHYGDRASRLLSLDQLRPLLDGPDKIILNGDTLDTRHGPHPERTARARAEVADFFGAYTPAVTHLTGNHDPDISAHHSLDLADGQIFVTHGDIIFDNVVPWGRDAAFFSTRLAAGLAALPQSQRALLAPRLALYRAACLALPQRHQSEPNPFKYFINLAADTVWPPLRTLRVFRAWQETPARAAAVAAAHRPAARFMLIGHTHRPGIWRLPSGLTVINTGSLTRPFGACVVDLTPGRLIVRRIEFRAAAFHPGAIVADFALAEVTPSPKVHP
jgi:predicted phosphodiesterase